MPTFNTNEYHYVKIASPYNVLTDENIIKMKVVSSASISSIKTYDVFKVVYEKYGLPETVYKEAIINDVTIVELVDCKNNRYIVPSSALEDFTGSAVEYINKTLSINLGVHPVDIDLTDLTNEIADLIKARLGVNPSISVLNTSNIILATPEILERLTQDRTAVTQSSTIGQLETVNAELVETTDKLNALTDYVTSCDCTCD